MYHNIILDLVNKLNKEANNIAYFRYETDGYTGQIIFLSHFEVCYFYFYREDNNHELDMHFIENQIKKQVKSILEDMNINLLKFKKYIEI